MDATTTFVIVGAGQAGRWLVLTLREQGFAGRIVWLGDEAHRPYERPPLSKAVIKGDVPLAQLELMSGEQFEAQQVEWRPGEKVVSIDRQQRTVTTDKGDAVHYDTLFLATGGTARCLPGLATGPRVKTLRTLEDALAIKQAMHHANSVLVLGGGWIGLELAASARTLGKPVTLVEAAPRLCIRTVPPCVSEELRQLHESHGVDLRLGVAVTGVDADDAAVHLRLANGEVLSADLLVVGIGLVANDALAAAAGIETGNGILTDAVGRTSDPHVFAVGDVANTLRADGTRLRLESWENAQRQAVVAARTSLGLAADPEADGAPWFWSDQFDDNLQMLGVPQPEHRVVARLNPSKRQRVYFFCEGPTVRAVAAINAGRDIKIVRRWMAQDKYPDIDTLADTSVDLNKLTLVSQTLSTHLQEQ